MRFPAFALLSMMIAAPAMAQMASAPSQPVAQSGSTPAETLAPRNGGRRGSVQAANETPAVFSEPTEPVPLLPNQRKLLRVRKV